MPDLKFKSLSEVPEGLKEEAKEVDGQYVVSVVPKARLDEFRDNNITLRKEVDTLKSKAETLGKIVGEDADKFASELTELRSLKQQVDDGKLKGSDAVEKAANDRIKALEAGHAQAIQELTQKLNAQVERGNGFESRFKRSVIDREVTNAVLAKDSGVNPSALPDILTRAYAVFQAEDNGSLVAKKGDEVLYGADAKPLQPKEWLTKVLADAPYLGLTSTGGGATGGTGKALGGLSREDFDKLSGAQQMSLARKAQK